MGRPSNKLQGKVAVITGGSRGIGLIMAASLAQAGAQIVICGRKMEMLEQVYTQLSSIPGLQLLALDCDVRHLEQVEHLAEQTINRFGQIDFWFNNAGILGPYAHVADTTAQAWADVIQTNLIGTFHGTQVALKHMLPRNKGKIINLISLDAQESKQLSACMSAYAASKAAILRFTQITAEEYKQSDLSILTMMPGLVRTDLTEIVPLTSEAEISLKKLDETFERFGTDIIEAGELAVRLASRETDGITGRTYEVKPGMGQMLRALLRR